MSGERGVRRQRTASSLATVRGLVVSRSGDVRAEWRLRRRMGEAEMSRGPDQLRLTPDERADLVAYVDGELPEATARAIATKLTQSATARREVEMLQKTWELLGHLPMPQVDAQFSERTLTH